MIAARILETLRVGLSQSMFELDSKSSPRIVAAIENQLQLTTKLVPIEDNSTYDPVGQLERLLGRIKNEIIALMSAMNNFPLSKHFSYLGKLSDLRTTLHSICENIVENVASFKSRRMRFYILIDEYDNLYMYQQKVINTIIQRTDAPITFKIGTKKLGLLTKEDISGRVLQVTHDYDSVSLDFEDPSDNRYLRYVEGICDQRLRFADASKSLRIRKWLAGIPIEREVEEESRSAPKKDSRSQQKLVRAPDNTEKGKDLILKEIKQSGHSSTKYDYYKIAASFRILRNKKYYGFETLALLSSGIIRNFLKLCRETWNISRMSKPEATVVISAPIICQHEAAVRVSDEEYSKIPDNIDVSDHRLSVQQLADTLGNIFRRRLHEDRMNEPECLRIEITQPERLSKEIREVLDAGIRGSIFQETIAELPKNIGVPLRAVGLNRLLCPHFHLSYRDRWSINIPSTILNMALEEPQRVLDYARNAKMRTTQKERLQVPMSLGTLSGKAMNPDNLPGQREQRVFVGGNYDFMVTLREIVEVVAKNDMVPIFAYDYEVPKDKVHDYDELLLHNCKFAIFEVTAPNGHLMELERTKDYQTIVLVLYQIHSAERPGFPPHVSSMLTTFVTNPCFTTKGYMTYTEMSSVIRDWLETVRPPR